MKKETINGVADMYNVFEVFDNSKGDIEKKYINTLERLIESNLLIIDTTVKKAVFFNKYFLSIIKNREMLKMKNQESFTQDIKGDFKKVAGNQCTFYSFDDDPYVTEKEKTIDLLKYSQTKHVEHFIRNNNREETYTENSILDVKNNFVLFPIRIVINGQPLYVNVRFIVYKHGYGIFNTSVNIADYSIEEFGKNKWNIPIDAAYLPNFVFDYEKKSNFIGKNKKVLSKIDSTNFKYKKIGGCKNLHDAVDRYIEIFQEFLLGKTSFKVNFNTLLVRDMTDIPQSFEEEPTSKFQENIFKLLKAPMFGSPISNKRDEMLELHSLNTLSFSKLYANQYRLIYVYAKNVSELYPEHQDRLIQEEFMDEYMYEAFKGDFIFAIEKLLLRKYSNWKYMRNFFAKFISPRRLYKLNLDREKELRYENNQIFYNYASTREIIDFLYKNCLDLHTVKILEENKERVIELSELRRNISISDFSFLATVFTFIFSVLFSIPLITDTLNFFQIYEREKILYVYKYFLILIFLIFCITFRQKILEGTKRIGNIIKFKYRTYKTKKNE